LPASPQRIAASSRLLGLWGRQFTIVRGEGPAGSAIAITGNNGLEAMGCPLDPFMAFGNKN
jgi:hypothetical protein